MCITIVPILTSSVVLLAGESLANCVHLLINSRVVDIVITVSSLSGMVLLVVNDGDIMYGLNQPLTPSPSTLARRLVMYMVRMTVMSSSQASIACLATFNRLYTFRTGLEREFLAT